jgi:hypothetical protein
LRHFALDAELNTNNRIMGRITGRTIGVASAGDCAVSNAAMRGVVQIAGLVRTDEYMQAARSMGVRFGDGA